MTDEVTKTWYEAAVHNQSEFGLYILKTLVVLNSGGIALLISLLSATKPDASILIELEALRLALFGFLAGILFAMLTAIIAYATALFSNPHSGISEIPFIGSTWVEAAYFGLGFTSMACFVFAVVSVANGLALA